ncbi:MAG: hypothetical protein J1G38_03250 [Clostridiales bacterium]|nr:hypothetical protein [Clostridiales bacterium]
MIGLVIEDDMLGVCARLKSIDEGYFVFLNYKTGKLEVHNKECAPNTLCLVLPYDRLDERTVRRVRYTRAERIRETLARIERENAMLQLN